MVDIRVLHPATATEQTLLVTLTEKFCNGYCIAGLSKVVSATVSFNSGAVKVINGIAVVPITANVTIVSPNGCNCNCAKTQTFIETFEVPFTATTTNAITLTPGSTVDVLPFNIKCCVANGVKVITTLTVDIA